MNSDLLNRKGIVKISEELLYGNPELVKEALKGMRIVSTSSNFVTNTILYYAYSKSFDIVKDGETIPEYEITAHTENGKATKVTIVRKKEYSQGTIKDIAEQINESLKIGGK